MSLYRISQPAPQESRQGVADLIRQLFQELTELIQQHIQLVKVELREEATRGIKAIALAWVGMVFFQVVLVFAGLLIMFALVASQQVSLVGGAAITALVFLIITGVCFGLCLQQVQSAKKVLKEGMEPRKEDASATAS